MASRKVQTHNAQAITFNLLLLKRKNVYTRLKAESFFTVQCDLCSARGRKQSINPRPSLLTGEGHWILALHLKADCHALAVD